MGLLSSPLGLAALALPCVVAYCWRSCASSRGGVLLNEGKMSSGVEREPAETARSFHWRWITPITVSLALVAVTTVILWLIEARLNQEHLIFIYFVPTALIAIRYGSLSAMGVTIASSLAAAFFLYPPQFSLLVANSLDVLELILFALLALLASKVVSGFANDSDIEKRRRRISPHDRIAALWNRIRSA
jgi:K+-sensing histidine kinase KdpD